MKAKKILAPALALMLLLTLCACGSGGGSGDTPTPTPGSSQQQGTPEPASDAAPEPTPEDAAPETVMFTDGCGREVEVPGEITRIVPSGPLAQIVLFAIAPDMFVGLAANWYDSARGIIPDEYFDLPYFGQLYGSANLNIEELAAQEPDIIIDVGEAKDSIAEDLDTLQEQTNIPAVFISSTLETMPQTYRTLGELLGREEKGEELAQFCERIYSRTMSIMDEVGENKVNALYITGEEGLNVLAQTSYHAELIDMLVNNIAVVDNPASKGSGNEVGMEQLLLWDPDFIVFSPGSVYSRVADDATWSQLTAIANRNYIETPEGPHNWMGSPPSVQRYLGMIWLPAVLYPDYCGYDVKADILEYYRLFYGSGLTDEQYDTLTANAFLK